MPTKIFKLLSIMCHLPKLAHNSTFILDALMQVLLKCSTAFCASSSVLKPTNPKWRNFPSLVYFNWTSVTMPFSLKSSLSFSLVICKMVLNTVQIKLHHSWDIHTTTKMIKCRETNLAHETLHDRHTLSS